MQMIRNALSRLSVQTTPRGRGVIALLALILLLAFATGESVLYRLTYFLTLATAGSYALAWFKLRGLDMRVEKQALARQAGDKLERFVRLRNNSNLPIDWVEVMDMSDMPGDMCCAVTQLPARGSEVWNARRFCYVRGVYRIGPLVARSTDPLGLFGVQTNQGDTITAVVYPATVELPRFSLPAVNLPEEEGVWHRLQTESAHAGTVREYNYGDSQSRIHWPSTAKHDRLMSKEFESGRSGDVWIVLDLERGVHKGKGRERTDEYCVAVAASVARLALTEERSVGMIAFGDHEYFVAPDGSGRQMSRVLEMLAWSKADGDIDLAEVLSRSAVKFGRSTSLLIITPSVAPEWVSVLPDLMRRGLSIAVVLVDPASFGGDESCYEVLTRLVSAGIRAYAIRKGDSISFALSRPITLHDLPSFEQYGAPELVPASQLQ